MRVTGGNFLAEKAVTRNSLAVTSCASPSWRELEPSACSTPTGRGSKVDAHRNSLSIVSSGIQFTADALRWLWSETVTKVGQHEREVQRRKSGSQGELMGAILFGNYVTQSGLLVLFGNNLGALPSDADVPGLEKRCKELLEAARAGYNGKLPAEPVDLEDLNRKLNALSGQLDGVMQVLGERVHGAAASLPSDSKG